MPKLLTEMEAFTIGAADSSYYDDFVMKGKYTYGYPSNERLTTAQKAEYWNGTNTNGQGVDLNTNQIVDTANAYRVVNDSGINYVGLSISQEIGFYSGGSGYSYWAFDPVLSVNQSYYNSFILTEQPNDLNIRCDITVAVPCFFFDYGIRTLTNRTYQKHYTYVGKGYDFFVGVPGTLNFTWSHKRATKGSTGKVRSYCGRNRYGVWEHFHLIGITPEGNMRGDANTYYRDGSDYNLWPGAETLPNDGVYIYDLGCEYGNSYEEDAVTSGFFYNTYQPRQDDYVWVDYRNEDRDIEFGDDYYEDREDDNDMYWDWDYDYDYDPWDD